MKIKLLWESALAKDLPAGEFPGQNFHPAGTKVAAAISIETERFRKISFIAPDPAYFYFNIAEKSLKQADALLVEVGKSQKPYFLAGKHVKEIDYKLTCQYFEKAIEILIFLYSGIEAFSNQRIPVLDKYPPDASRKKAYKTKEEFERKASVVHKLNIIAKARNKEKLSIQKFWYSIEQLIKIRHEIIHLKTKGRQFTQMYNQIYIDLIDCNLKNIFSSTIELIKFIDDEF